MRKLDVSPIDPRSALSRATRRRILQGTLARLAGRAAGGVVSLVALHYATRYFGPSVWGSIVAAIALYTVFSAIGDFGTGKITSREVARTSEGASSVYGTSLAAATLLGLAGAGLLVAVGALLYFSHGETLRYVLVLSPAVLFMAWWQTSASVLTARERNDVRAVLDVGSSLLLLAGVLVILSLQESGLWYVLVATGSVALTAVVALVLASSYVKPHLAWDRRQIKRFVRRSAPVGASLMLFALYLRVGVVLLTLFRGDREVGAYGVAVQIAMFIMSTPAFLMGAVLAPFMQADRRERLRLTQHALWLLISVSLPIPVFLGLFAHGFVTMLSGRSFASAAHPLVILGVASTIWCVNIGVLDLVINEGGEDRLLRPLGQSAALSIAMSLLVVPWFGMDGAACVIIGTELVNLYQFTRLHRSLTGFVPDLRAVVPAAVGVAVVAGVSQLVVHLGSIRISSGPVLVAQVLAAATLYGAAFTLCYRLLRRRWDPVAVFGA